MKKYKVIRQQTFNVNADSAKEAEQIADKMSSVYNDKSFIDYDVTEICCDDENFQIVDKLNGVMNYLNDDVVNHPKHYKSKNGLEVIDVIKAFTDGLEGIEAVCTANIIKYVCRWKNKNGKQDLEKAVWYAKYLIDILKEKEIKK